MRRRRLPSRRGGRQTGLVRRAATTDLRFLEQVVCIAFPISAARSYLARNMANKISYQLVEAVRGEQVGNVRLVEVKHSNGGERTWVRGLRVLANGEPASFFVPDHLVRVEPEIDGLASDSRTLSVEDEIILHVPVRGYLRFLPSIFQGEGPVSSRRITRTRDSALQRWGGVSAEAAHVNIEFDEDPVRRFMFLFQHVMTTLTDQIDRLADLTDPLMVHAKFLPWLASWVNFPLDESLPVNQQRELVRRAIRLVRTRGTRGGIEEMVRVLTAAPVRIRERVRPQPCALGRMHLIGGRDVVERYRKVDPPGSYLVEPSGRQDTTYFTLTLEPRERFSKRFGERAPQVLRQIAKVVSQERPTHVAFTIAFDVRGGAGAPAGRPAPPPPRSTVKEETAPAVVEAEAAPEPAKPRFAKVDRSKRGRKAAEEETPAVEAAPAAEEPPPKKKAARRRKKKEEPAAEAAEAAPKKATSRRRSRKKTEEPAAEAAADAPAEEKPKTSSRRSRKKKTDAAAPAEDKPKTSSRRRSRKKKE